MIAQQEPAKKAVLLTGVRTTFSGARRPTKLSYSTNPPKMGHTLLTAIGITGIVTGMILMANLLLSLPVQGKTLTTTLSVAPAAAVAQQPILVNGRAVYTAPIVTGPTATALLQRIPPGAIAYAIHTFTGRGKSVSTALSWFRCADIVTDSEYSGSQGELESWALLTEQERMELQAACSL